MIIIQDIELFWIILNFNAAALPYLAFIHLQISYIKLNIIHKYDNHY